MLGADPAGPHRNLFRRLFSRDVQDRSLDRAASREVEQQGRFTDSRLPADKDRTPGDEAAAEHLVKL